MSPRAACRLESLGFTQVYDYVTGLSDWTANGLPTEGTLADIPTAGDVVRRDIPTCRLTERLVDAAKRAKAAGQNTCIVTSEGGIVLGRLRGGAFNADPEASVESAMESGPTTVRPDELLEGLTERMRSRVFRAGTRLADSCLTGCHLNRRRPVGHDRASVRPSSRRAP